jgi:hypothetical protein
MMRKLSLRDWAAVAEIVGTTAVVVSLVFVIQSVNQNTQELQSANLNHVYDRYDSFNSDVASSPELASHYAKKVLKIEGIDARDAQLLALMRRELNQWEQYFVWHSGGLLSESDWQDWDGYFRLSISNALPQEWWLALRPYYQGTQGEFRAHVDRVYESQ